FLELDVGLHVLRLPLGHRRHVALDPAVVLQQHELHLRTSSVAAPWWSAPLRVCRSGPPGCDIACAKVPLKIEIGSVGGRDEVVVLGVAPHPLVDEGTEGEDSEPFGAGLLEGEAGRAPADAPPFEALAGLGVDQGEQAGAEAVDDEAGGLAAGGGDESAAFRGVGDDALRIRVHALSSGSSSASHSRSISAASSTSI